MTCPSTQPHEDVRYVPEIWTWFSIGTLVTVTRLAMRLREVGLRNWQGDDVLAVAVWLCSAGKSTALTMVFLYGSNMDYITQESVVSLSSCQLDRVTSGSQMELLAWYTYCSIIWGLKGMVLFMFARFRLALERIRLFKFVVMCTAVSYVGMFLTMCFGCLPYHQNWQVEPPPPRTCSLRLHDLYVSTILNVATDLLILAIPLPTLWTMQVKLGKKIGLTILLCSGIFVMVAAVIRFGFTLTGYTSANLNKWCQRETAVGFIAVNIPILWTGLKPLFLRKTSSRLPARKGHHPSSVADMQCQEVGLHHCRILGSAGNDTKPPRCGILTSASSGQNTEIEHCGISPGVH